MSTQDHLLPCHERINKQIRICRIIDLPLVRSTISSLKPNLSLQQLSSDLELSAND